MGQCHLLWKVGWDRVFETVWDGDETQGYTFKRSHSISYAALVALHMNVLSQDA